MKLNNKVRFSMSASTKTKARKPRAAKKAVVTTKEFDLVAEEKRLKEKYSVEPYNQKIVHGSLKDICTDKNDEHFNKRTVEIKCQHPGCGKVFRIATSDLFQVKYCEEHTREMRLQKRRDERAAARGKKAK